MEFDQNSFSKVRFSDIFVKKIVSSKNTYNSLEETLYSYADQHGFDKEETLYIFTKKIIKDLLFFSMKEEVSAQLLYNTAYWSSLNESKHKTRPKDGQSMSKIKEFNLFTKLQQELILSLFKVHNKNQFMLDIELNKYLIFFYELSCIKRDRRKK